MSIDIDSLVEEILDIAREQSHADAVIIIRDRIEKDVIKPLQQHEQAVRAEGWLPIETAPKDGTEILLGHGNSVWIDQWIEFEDGAACWMMCDQWSEPEVPSHWQPLPEPPAIRRADTIAETVNTPNKGDSTK